MFSGTCTYFSYRRNVIFSNAPSNRTQALTLILLFLTLQFTYAQKARITIYGSQVKDINVQYDVPTGKLQPNPGNSNYQAGGGIEWLVNKEVRVELLYLHQTRQVNSGTIPTSASRVVGMNYIMASAGDYFINRGGRIKGFAGICVGTSVLQLASAENDRALSSAKISCGARVAGSYWFASNVGVKLESMLLYTQNANYTSTVTAGPNLLTAASICQLTLGAGLMFSL